LVENLQPTKTILETLLRPEYTAYVHAIYKFSMKYNKVLRTIRSY